MSKWKRRRPTAPPPSRREAHTLEALVRQIADDHTLPRFRKRPADAEKPRDVYQAAADELAAPYTQAGWRYARSGPHLTRRVSDLTSQIRFASSTSNVAGSLVVLTVHVIFKDHAHTAWRQERGLSPVPFDAVLNRHLGHFLQPPVWLEWNLADPATRPQTIADIAHTLATVAVPALDRLGELVASPSYPQPLFGLVNDSALLEYHVRAGRTDEAARILEQLMAQLDPRPLRWFRDRVTSLARGETAPWQAHGLEAVARTVAELGLPVPPEATNPS